MWTPKTALLWNDDVITSPRWAVTIATTARWKKQRDTREETLERLCNLLVPLQQNQYENNKMFGVLFCICVDAPYKVIKTKLWEESKGGHMGFFFFAFSPPVGLPWWQQWCMWLIVINYVSAIYNNIKNTFGLLLLYILWCRCVDVKISLLPRTLFTMPIMNGWTWVWVNFSLCCFHIYVIVVCLCQGFENWQSSAYVLNKSTLVSYCAERAPKPKVGAKNIPMTRRHTNYWVLQTLQENFYWCESTFGISLGLALKSSGSK